MAATGWTLKKMWCLEKGHPNIELQVGRYYSVEVILKVENQERKGLGLIARSDIPRGTKIIEEPPIYKLSMEMIKEAWAARTLMNLDKDIEKEIKALPDEDQKNFFSLVNCKKMEASNVGRMLANGRPMGNNECGVFPIIARTNHSCYPNCHFSYNPDTGEGSLYSIKKTFQGEELTIAYRQDGPSFYRHRGLMRQFGFDCNCELCVLKLPDEIASNRRQVEILQLLPTVNDPTLLLERPAQSLWSVYQLLKLYEGEDITDERLNAAYYRAFEIHVTHGDLARGKIFAERAHREIVVCEGPYHPLSIKMNDLIKKPEGVETYGSSERWKLGVREVPDFVEGEEDFETWLWRRAGVKKNRMHPMHPEIIR